MSLSLIFIASQKVGKYLFHHAGPDKPAPASFKPGTSSNLNRFWIQAFAGMTVWELLWMRQVKNPGPEDQVFHVEK